MDVGLVPDESRTVRSCRHPGEDKGDDAWHLHLLAECEATIESVNMMRISVRNWSLRGMDIKWWRCPWKEGFLMSELRMRGKKGV
ncbi:hypothetical protein J2129_002490 [Methanofollis sp. W23]|uniref:hypothetical protein n=1 Tax=Methanofollis sp. W23 TaxID=2817849 RepID=UPI001AE4F128|nr:hypothetical protein [Methanofollis sp. W23]MBP2147036.1 hypothetical protein [Methanofollis sp. W23]